MAFGLRLDSCWASAKSTAGGTLYFAAAEKIASSTVGSPVDCAPMSDGATGGLPPVVGIVAPHVAVVAVVVPLGFEARQAGVLGLDRGGQATDLGAESPDGG